MEDSRTLFVGNIAEEVTEELLYELFLQAGPLEKVKIPKDREGRKSTFGFVTFKHYTSLEYTINLFGGIKLFERTLNIRPRKGGPTQHQQYNPLQQQHQQISPRIWNSLNMIEQQPPNQHIRYDDTGNLEATLNFLNLANMNAMMNLQHNNIEEFNGNRIRQHQNERGGRLQGGSRERSHDRRDFNRSRNEFDRERIRTDRFDHQKNRGINDRNSIGKRNNRNYYS